ncbi:MAG: anthranilate phosphoribosyltransferase [Armatimonadaceae bacterium]
MKYTLEKLLSGHSLTTAEAAEAMGSLMDGAVPPVQIGAFLTALRIKGETVDEITGFAEAMRARSLRVTTHRSPLVDTCGTGGDTIKTFNISTTAAFVVAAAGVPVAKHGNRSVTSKCGSADVLEALGVRLDLVPEAVGHCIDEIGIGFLFARSHHPAMKYAAPVRAELGFRTVFNLLGPLTNPAGATRQVIGVYDAALCEPLAQVLGKLGAERALVVHGEPGMDEISTLGTSVVAELRDGKVTSYVLTPAELGLSVAVRESLIGEETPEANAAVLWSVLNGTETGARREIVLANAAAALYVAGVVESLVEGVDRARTVLESGAAAAQVEKFVSFTQQLAEATA